MNDTEYKQRDGSDPRLAVHAASRLPAWLWSSDGARILWANAAGITLFGGDRKALSAKAFGPADSHRRQVAQLARRLLPNGAVRLERLRGFGAAPGSLATCACARLEFADGGAGVLVVAMLSPADLERIERGHPKPAVRQAAPVASLVLEPLPESRVHAEITPTHQPEAAAMDDDALDYEQPATTGEAPAEFALLEEIGDGARAPDAAPAAEAPVESAAKDELPPPLQTIEPRRAGAGMPPWLDHPPLQPRRHPLRFIWQMDAEGRFALGSDEFARLIGMRTAAGFGRFWSEIAEVFGLDPEGRVARALATRDTWSGIALDWPVDGGARLRVELSGLPMFDRARNFAGYRGFGVCRDLEGLARLDALRRTELFGDAPAPSPLSAGATGWPVAATAAAASESPRVPDVSASMENENSPPTDVDHAVETPKNVLPFRAANEPKSPSLTPVENNAFNELARQLAARLDSENSAAEGLAPSEAPEPDIAPPTPQSPAAEAGEDEGPEWLSEPEPPPRGETGRDGTVLDLLPDGVLIYRLDRLLHANPAFLRRVGYDSLHALEETGGLDALLVEPGVPSVSSTSETGTPVTISQPAADAAAPATAARLHAILWDGEPAHALICGPRADTTTPADVADAKPLQVGHANAEELGAILDTAAEGVVMFDAEGNLNSCNRSAEALFGYDGADLVRRNLTELFAPESRDAVQNYLQSVAQAGAGSLDHGREVLGQVREGGVIPLSITMGRTLPDSPNFFAVFRELSQTRKVEAELARSVNARSDVLARISHEVRTPLNTIIGFAEVMIDERFGALGNTRYTEYTKDIRASADRVMAIINDLNDLSRIEAGKLDLAFANQNLNDLVEQCVAVMQPQANRERIIIRTSLAHALPPVVADAAALRQIALNLIGNSIHLANAGGQVIVSTALSDFGEVVLRVRDTGFGLNEEEVAAALEPFRTLAPPDQMSAAGASLSLTKALVEANRAQFHIRPGAQSGTLIEVVFGRAMAPT